MDQTITIPCPPFDVQLSHWDRLFPPMHSKRILCFSLPEKHSRGRIIGYLHTAFYHTVHRVPFLAGSIVPFPPDQGGRPWLRNLVAEGAARLVIKDLSAELSFAELEKANFAQNLLDTDQLCPLPKTGYVQDEPVDVCQFQANFIEGGLLLVVSIIHIAADGRGVTDIIKIFAEQLRKAQSAAATVEPLASGDAGVYRSDRTALLSGHGAPGDIKNHVAWTSSPTKWHVDVANSCRTYRITPEGLARLRQLIAASFSGSGDWASTNDVISAFIWRSIMMARHKAGILATDGTTSVVLPVDCRDYLGLPQPYFGNAIYMTKSSIPLQALADPGSGLAEAARLVRGAIQDVTAEKFRDLVGYAERTEREVHTRLNILEELLTGGIIMTSHFKFDLHSVDFGPAFSREGDGHMKALRWPSEGTMAGTVIVMPKLTDGSCEFLVTEQASMLAALEGDAYFKQFTHREHPALGNDVQQPKPVLIHTVDLRSCDEGGKMPAINVAEICPAPPIADDSPTTTVRETLTVHDVKATHMGMIRVIQLNRPKVKNAISTQMLNELGDGIQDISGNTPSGEIRALVLASTSDDVFSTGADLKERRTMTVPEVKRFLGCMRDVFARLEALPIPTIACVSGHALGGGLELALCCHLRVFTSNATAALPETRLGIIPGAGGTYRLPKIVGSALACDLVLTGRIIGASEAYARGLCNRLVSCDLDPDSGVTVAVDKRAVCLDTGIELAREITAGGPVAIRMAIRALSCPSEIVENASYEVLLGTRDRDEALLAFAEERSPVFTGQ
ncbi:putative enoyl-CoA hydratase/isomerase family protein [Nemania sp. FL0031]|nr:putative enoyl-CoA hydratase/isomerase family protein [Nemania sp. FL0031]